MKTVRAIREIQLDEGGGLRFKFAFADGSTKKFHCLREVISSLLLQVSAFNMSRIPGRQTESQQMDVSFEAGVGRVAISIVLGGEVVHVIMGHERAEMLGRHLIEAAGKSTAPISRN